MFTTYYIVGKHDMASTTTDGDDDDDTGLLSVGISWSRILYVNGDGSLSTFGDAFDADNTTSLTPQHCLQVSHVFTHVFRT